MSKSQCLYQRPCRRPT